MQINDFSKNINNFINYNHLKLKLGLSAIRQSLGKLCGYLVSWIHLPERICKKIHSLGQTIFLSALPSANSKEIENNEKILQHRVSIDKLPTEVLTHILKLSNNNDIPLVSKDFQIASQQSMLGLFHDFKQVQKLSCLAHQAEEKYPNGPLVHKINEQRIQFIYKNVLERAKNWHGYETMLANTKNLGTYSVNRLEKIAQWISDQHLIFIVKTLNTQYFIVQESVNNLHGDNRAENIRTCLSK